jgi:hypothetical protein
MYHKFLSKLFAFPVRSPGFTQMEIASLPVLISLCKYMGYKGGVEDIL